MCGNIEVCIFLYFQVMGKSRAEIQKAYRERKKQNDGESLLAKGE